MFTVLVPLAETSFAESILPDAVSLAGPGGRLALVYVLRHRRRGSDETGEADDAERYLANEGRLLQARGYQVVVKVLVGADIPQAINEGVAELRADTVAVATHGTGGGA